MTARQRTVLAILVVLGFAYVYTMLVMAPVLVQLSGEFEISIGTTGLATAAFGVPGAIVAVLAGPFSDRYGRKRFLLTGTALMGLGTLITAAAPSFELLLAARAIAGTGAALGYSSLYASVADHFSQMDRPRATAIVFSGTTMADIIGIPIAGIVGEATSWRVSLLIVALLALVGAALVALWLPRSESTAVERSVRTLYLLVLRNRSAVLLLAVGFLGAFAYFSWAAYVVAYFQQVYGLSQGVASAIAISGGLGLFAGGHVAAWAGHRVGHRCMLLAVLVLFGIVIFGITAVTWPLWVAVALNLFASLIVAMRFVGMTSLMTEQVPGAQATLLSLLSAMFRTATVGGTVAGVLIDLRGFSGLGLLALVVGVLAAVPVLWVRDQTYPHSHTLERLDA